VITGASLAEFLLSFEHLQVSKTPGSVSANVKFGKAIDTDEKPTVWEEPVNEYVSVTQSLQWDLEIKRESLGALASAIGKHNKTIYRAFIQLGAVVSPICRSLTRMPSPENKLGLTLDSWSLEIGPIMSGSLESEQPFFVGWISLSLSGNGYLFPWTFAELFQRATVNPAIQQVTELCKATWPVEAKRPDRRIQKFRQQMGELWPYAETDLPWDWYWGVSERG
jgi:hypothetical protein